MTRLISRFVVEEFYSAEGELPWCVVDNYQIGSNGENLILGRFSTKTDAENCVGAIFQAVAYRSPV